MKEHIVNIAAIVTVATGFFLLMALVAHQHHEETMAHIAAGQVLDTNGNWARP